MVKMNTQTLALPQAPVSHFYCYDRAGHTRCLGYFLEKVFLSQRSTLFQLEKTSLFVSLGAQL